MSLILDALKRAENERSAILSSIEGGSVPASPQQRSKTGRLAAWVILLLAVAITAYFGWKFWSAKRAAPDPVASAPAAKPAPATPRTASKPRSPPARPKVIPGTEGVASLDDVTQPEAKPPAEPVATSKQALKADLREPPPAAAATPEPEQAAVAEDGAEESGATPEPPQAGAKPAPAVEPPPSLKQPATLPRFKEMPPAYRSDFPAITIEVHVHDAAPARRWVMINGVRYREGQKLSTGPVIREITADGVVFDYRGETFLYPLRSWPVGL